METGIIEIAFTDGRIFNVFFANATQKRKLLSMYNNLTNTKSMKFICRGIHTVNQFEQQLKFL